jgi:hypothetical protein
LDRGVDGTRDDSLQRRFQIVASDHCESDEEFRGEACGGGVRLLDEIIEAIWERRRRCWDRRLLRLCLCTVPLERAL